MAPNTSNGSCVLLFPFPYQGHINPMYRLAAALHARGFAITMLHTEFRAPDTAGHPEYRFLTIPDNIPAALAASEDAVALVRALNANCEAPFRDLLASLLSGGGNREEQIRCVVTDVSWYLPLAAARELGVPALVLMTSSAASLLSYMAYPLLIEKGYLPVKESELDVLVEELPPFRVRDLLRIDTSSLDAFAGLLANFVECARQSSGVVLNTFDAIEGSALEKLRVELSIPVFAVGPLHKFSPISESNLLCQDRSCLEWLDTQAPSSVVYVSFGSLAILDADQFAEMAWGLVDSKHPFVWVVRPGSVRSLEHEKLPSELEEKIYDAGKIISWSPQQEVLAHPAVGAFVTHSGWNSVLEAISEGVPMTCRPCFADQMGNARYTCDVWKVGTEIGNQLDREKIKVAIETLMNGKEGRTIRGKMGDLKDMVAKCISKGGSSHTALDNLVNFIMSL